jgi:hypothetical protein
MDEETEYEEIILLEEFAEALCGCVFDPEGTPIPCYQTEVVWKILEAEGFGPDDADDYIELLTDGMRLVWIHPLELQPEFEPDRRPNLRLVPTIQ